VEDRDRRRHRRRKSGGGGDDFDVAFLADDEGVSVTFTILFPPSQP